MAPKKHGGWESPRREEPRSPDVTEEDGKAVVSRDGKKFVARAAVTETDAYAKQTVGDPEELPNMLFVPLKTREPHVPAREFMVFIFMLVAFTMIHKSQHFTEDFVTNSGMADMCNIDTGFVKIATQADYAAWFPSLVVALRTWAQARDEFANATTLPGSGPAVLLGKPMIMQRRLPGAQNAINGTRECLWAPRDYGQGAGPTCYGAAMGWSGDDPLMGVDGTPGQRSEHAVVYLDHIEDILSAGSAWDPRDWIDTATTEIVHYFQVWLPTEQRIATIKIAASFERTGRVQPRDRDQALPVFRTQEPFLARTDPKEFYGELLFYCVMAYYLWGELLEVWECICIQELLLPLEILVDAFELSLLEISHFHAKTSEVYDPRDPKTHAAFNFPDTADLDRHLTHCITPIRDTLEQEEQKLKALRVELAELGKDALRSKEGGTQAACDRLHRQLLQIHKELMTTHTALDREIEVAETAAILQLAVMWNNHWSMDFPPRYLNEIGNPKDGERPIDEDGQAAFCAINWIDVARDYTTWVHSGEAHNSVYHKAEGGRYVFKTHRLGIMGEQHLGLQFSAVDESVKAQAPQAKHFTSLAPLVDYLDMLRDTLSLHQSLVNARAIKYWNGPKMETSHTVDQAFQQLIRDYNAVGQGLVKEMQSFPEEIENGFHDPQPVMAETTKINARRIQKDLLTKLNTAQTLGFFFPGSTMWELRRKLRAGGNYNKGANVRLSIMGSAKLITASADAATPVEPDATLVASGSMSLYLQAGDTAGADCTVDYSVPKPKRSLGSKLARKRRQSGQQRPGGKMVSNPLHGEDQESGGSSSDSDSDDVDALDTLQLLQKLPFLERVKETDVTQLEDMATGCAIKEYAEGEFIIKEGSEDLENMYVLVKGDAVAKKKGVNDGGILQHYRRFELFGEKLDPRHGRKASVVANKNGTKCLALNQHARDVLSRSVASGVLDGNYETAGQAARIYGTRGWRDWVPHSARHVVNHDGQFFTADQSLMKKLPHIYPLWLYVSEGFGTYFGNGWNVLEFVLYSLFMVALYCKVEMWRLEPVLEEAVVKAVSGDADYVDVLRFDYLNWLYMLTLTPNAIIMWIKLLKYVGVVPQMDILIRVISKAVPSVTIFTFVAIIPVLGLAYSFTAVFGDTLYRYSTVSLSLNTLLRMSVGDFDFEELYAVSPPRAVVMFWLSALLIVFCLINIFVAIILNAYDLILQTNPEANDASQFISMLIMQAKRTAMGALAAKSIMKRDSLEPHVLVNQMERIEDETYWDIFQGYFALGGHGVDKAQQEHAAELGGKEVDETGSASSRQPTASRGEVAALQAQLDGVAATVDKISRQQESYARSARGLEEQQKEILELLQTIHAKTGS